MLRLESIVVAAVVSVIALVVSTASAAVITTADGDGADSYIRGGKHAAHNHGNGAVTYASYQRQGKDYSRKTYLRFDLSTLPADWKAQDVKLKVQITDAAKPELRVFGLKDDSPGQNWIETGKNGSDAINFKNAPANHPSGPWFTQHATGKLASSKQANKLGVITFSSEQLTEFINTDTDGIVTLMIVQAGSYEYMSMASKEHKTAMAPTLDITLQQ